MGCVCGWCWVLLKSQRGMGGLGMAEGRREFSTFMASELSLTTFGESHIKRNEMENLKNNNNNYNSKQHKGKKSKSK